MSRRTTAACLLVLAAGCGLPRDPEGTLDRVRGGTLRVGVAHNPPWAVLAPGAEPAGVEPRLARALAAELGARVEWVPGGESALLRAVEEHRLDLVVGGPGAADPRAATLGFTRPYYTDTRERRVLVVPPGENAWLVRVERFLHARRGEVPALLRREAP